MHAVKVTTGPYHVPTVRIPILVDCFEVGVCRTHDGLPQVVGTVAHMAGTHQRCLAEKVVRRTAFFGSLVPVKEDMVGHPYRVLGVFCQLDAAN